MKRSAVYGLVGFVLWIVLVIVWASRPQFDAVATGFDQTLTPPQAVSSRVTCSNLWSSNARSRSPLPVLTPQPEGSPALFFRRPPCVRWHNQGRILLLTDFVFTVGIVGVAVTLSRRLRRREPDH